MIFNLHKKLAEWVGHSLLSEAQSREILRHEDALGGKPWVVYGITGIGVTAIAVGIISLVAANWMDISALLKLIVYFSLQASLGAGFFYFSGRTLVWREVLLTLFALVFFAGIGLVAQIYNLHSEPWRGLVFWLVLTFPLTQVARSQMLVHLWVVVSLYTSWAWAGGFGGTGTETYRWGWTAAYPLLLTAASFLAERWNLSHRAFRTAILVWGVGVTLGIGTILMNIQWLETRLESHLLLTRSIRIIPEIALLLVAAASLLRPDSVSRSQKIVTAALFLVFGIFFFYPMEFPGGFNFPLMNKVAGATGFLFVWALAAAAVALAGYRRLFDIASLIIAIRFIVIYFEVFGSLSTTGIGLIFSGVVILAVCGLWSKYRKTVGGMLEGRS
jgi:hypothetical protein